MCDLNCSVPGRVSSLSTSFWTPSIVNLVVSALLDTSKCEVRGVCLVPLPGKLRQYIQSTLFALKMNIYGLDISELTVKGVQKFVLELETHS